MRKLWRSRNPEPPPSPANGECGEPAVGGVSIKGEPPCRCQLPKGHDGYHECADAYDNHMQWKVNYL